MMRWNSENGGGANGSSHHTGDGLLLHLCWPSPLMRAAIRALLERLGNVVVATSDAWPALLGGDTIAQVVVVDIELFSGCPLAMPASPVVVIAPTAGHPGLAAAIESGVAGLVLGSESTDLLRLCLATVSSGGRWFDTSAMNEVFERDAAAKDAALLTRRERDVARLVATGQRNRAIAGSLGISEGTVKMHLHNVYAKLGLESRTQLAMDERLRMRG